MTYLSLPSECDISYCEDASNICISYIALEMYVHAPCVHHLQIMVRSAMFTVTHMSCLYVYVLCVCVFQLEKVLQQGDIGESCEPYMVMKESDSSKVTVSP